MLRWSSCSPVVLQKVILIVYTHAVNWGGTSGVLINMLTCHLKCQVTRGTWDGNTSILVPHPESVGLWICQIMSELFCQR